MSFAAHVTAQQNSDANIRKYGMDSLTPKVSEKNIVTWYLNDDPPTMIVNGEDQGQGFIDRILYLLEQEMPEHEFVFVSATFPRALHDIKLGKEVCYPALFKTEQRKAFVAFTQMSIMHPSNYITMSRQLAEQLDIKEQVDLLELMQNRKLIFGLESQRSFGFELDSLLQDSEYINKAGNVIRMRVSETAMNKYRMLVRGRIDYILDYPFETYYSLGKLARADDFVSFPIAHTPQFTMGAIGCAKTPWGEDVVRHLDRALSKVKGSPEYKEALTAWLQEFVVDERFEDFYQQHFLTQ